MAEYFSYTIRVVNYPENLNRHDRFGLEAKDRLEMSKKGWSVVNAAHYPTHTAITYQRPAGINSVYLMAEDYKIVCTTLDC